MKKSEILAHRGLWRNDLNSQNTIKSLEDALESGFGIELDVRDFKGSIVISHGPCVDSPVYLEDFFSKVNLERYKSNSIYFNVKSDGLLEIISPEMLTLMQNSSNFYFFDMSVPEFIKYSELGLNVVARLSEYEKSVSFISPKVPLLVDAFHEDWWISENIIEDFHNHNSICFISPELHQRDVVLAWEKFAYINKVFPRPIFHICTDFPEELASILC